jgi:hypothetical protein
VSTILDLPEDIAKRLLSFFAETGGEPRVADMAGFISFVAEHSETYPILLSLININEGELIRHFEETGEVPPGVKLIGTTTEEGSNVTHLEILQGPIPPRK